MYCKTNVLHRQSMLCAFIFLLPIISIMVFYSNALSAQVTLAWDPNNEPDIAGYQVYYGTSTGIYTDSIDVNNSTTCTISDLEEGQTYYFAVTAYNSSYEESGFSNEVVNTISSSPYTFEDVPPGHWAEDAIYDIYDAGITNGCSEDPLLYCPDDPVSKAVAPVFLLRSIHGGNYTPPPATGIFTDVDVNQWYAPWIEQLYREDITEGCSSNPLMYCPDEGVSKAAMAVFLLRAIHGGNYTPPPATGIFTDVNVNQWYAPWIEQLYREDITEGCSSNPLMYCPDKIVSRAAMALFLDRTFDF